MYTYNFRKIVALSFMGMMNLKTWNTVFCKTWTILLCMKEIQMNHSCDNSIGMNVEKGEAE